MARKISVTQEDFDQLLQWLDRDRETAGRKYENIRQRLIRIFIGRGCPEAEDLTDETINRVALKLRQVVENYIGEPALYFYGVANNIHHEWLRRQKRIKNVQFADAGTFDEQPESDTEYECLENCLETLPAGQRALIVDYYRKEKFAKIEHRRALAEKLNITVSALQIRTSRIRTGLRECVEDCVSKKEV